MFRKMKQILYRSIKNNNEISYDFFKELTKNSQIILIDVRSNQEYEEGHLNGAININVYNIQNEIDKIVKNKEKNIIIYCSSGYRSRKAKEILNKMGYTNVYVLKNGIDNLWIK